MGTFSIWHWLVVLVVVILVFGTKKLRNVGGDLGAAVRNFREGMRDGAADAGSDDKGRTLEGEAKREDGDKGSRP